MNFAIKLDVLDHSSEVEASAGDENEFFGVDVEEFDALLKENHATYKDPITARVTKASNTGII